MFVTADLLQFSQVTCSNLWTHMNSNKPEVINIPNTLMLHVMLQNHQQMAALTQFIKLCFQTCSAFKTIALLWH